MTLPPGDPYFRASWIEALRRAEPYSPLKDSTEPITGYLGYPGGKFLEAKACFMYNRRMKIAKNTIKRDDIACVDVGSSNDWPNDNSFSTRQLSLNSAAK